MPDPGIILPYLAYYFNVPMPRYVLGARLPKGVLGFYDPRTMTIYFRDLDPDIDVITHEFGHHLHTVLGLEGSRGELEALANRIEKALTEFYGQEPRTYGLVTDYEGYIPIILGLALLIWGCL